jgi:hypothetical protein
MVEFTNREELEIWLADKPREWARVLAARVALRVLPVALSPLSRDMSQRSIYRPIALPIVRSVALAWAAARYQAVREHSRYATAVAASSFVMPLAGWIPPMSLLTENETIDAMALQAIAAATAANFSEDEARLQTVTSIVAAAAATNDLEMWRAASFDASDLEKRNNPALLAELQLWLPSATFSGASSLIDLQHYALRDMGEHWEVWNDWYQARLHGRDPWPEAVEIACALIPDEIWKQGPSVVNAEIRRIRERGASEQEPDSITSPEAPPTVPAQKPAALQPEFRDGKLVLPKSPSVSKLKGQSPTASLKALREELRDLADVVQNEANIDRRVSTRLRGIAEKIPDRAPRQDVLISIGHILEELQDYSGKANAEWPNVLASRYHAMVRNYDRTLRQFPKWLEWIAATRPPLSREQIDAAPGAARQLADALRDDEVKAQVDPALPAALEAMASTLDSKSNSSAAFDDPLALATDALAHDVLESVGNTYKTIASKAVDVSGRAISEYGVRFEKGIVDEAGKQGDKHARAAIRLLFRAAFSTGFYGLTTGAQHLTGFYPEYFGWLIPIAAFFAAWKATKPEEKPAAKKQKKPT